MLSKCNIVAFAPTRDADRAVAFYRDTLGLTLTSQDNFATVFDANGIMLRVTPVPALTPHPFTLLGWDVPNIAATAEELAAKGVAFERYPGIVHDELGIWTAPSGARVAWFKDPDGNLLSLTEFTSP
ncbi:MAG TPA: VOC family protein [Bryobacteraceae bacterium]|jgi:catechol 2,3-dioxygenase-like lactoylglutathione lyase family enzyme